MIEPYEDDISPDSPDSESEPTEAPEGMRSVRRVIAVGGGRGGVGKSLVASNLAVYFAQLGKQVVLVDADPTGSNLHTQFGLTAASRDVDLEVETPAAIEKSLVATAVPGLRLLPSP